MAQLTIQNVTTAGAALTAVAAAAGGDKIRNPADGRLMLEVANGGGAAVTVTIAKQVSSVKVPHVGTLTVSDLTVSVPAGATRKIGPFSQGYQDANGDVNISYSAVTSVTVAAITIPEAV